MPEIHSSQLLLLFCPFLENVVLTLKRTQIMVKKKGYCSMGMSFEKKGPNMKLVERLPKEKLMAGTAVWGVQMNSVRLNTAGGREGYVVQNNGVHSDEKK